MNNNDLRRFAQYVKPIHFALIAVFLICFSLFFSGSGEKSVGSNKPTSMKGREIGSFELSQIDEVAKMEVAEANLITPVSTKGTRFSATPTTELRRGSGDRMLFPDAVRYKRAYTKGLVFDESALAVKQGEADGHLSQIGDPISVVEAEMDLGVVERFLASDAEFLPMPLNAEEEALLRVKWVYDRGEHTVTLVGEVDGYDELSAVNFVFHDGAISGSIELLTTRKQFDYNPSGDGDVAIQEVDLEARGELECGGCQNGTCAHGEGEDGSVALSEEFDSRSILSLDEDEAANVSEASVSPALASLTADDSLIVYSNDVVVGYTAAVNNRFNDAAGVEANVINQIDRINSSYVNSLIFDTCVTLVATIRDTFPNQRFAGDGSSNIGSHETFQTGETDTQALQRELGADFTIAYFTGGGGAASHIPETAANPGTTNPITFFVSGTNFNILFPHEFGHLAGGFHSGPATDFNPVTRAITTLYTYRHGWQLITTSGDRFRTIMSNNNAGYSVVYRYSTPDQVLSGARLGAVQGYNATNDNRVSPLLRGFYNGTRSEFGADNVRAINTYKAAIPSLYERVEYAILEPAANSVVQSGGTLPIAWTGGDHKDIVTIDLYRNGVFQETLDSEVAAYGWHDAILPSGQVGGNYTVRARFDSGEVVESGEFAISLTDAVVVGNGSGYDETGVEATSYKSFGTVKNFDAEGDNIYGSSGYFFFGNGVDNSSNENGLPTWVTGVDYSGSIVVFDSYTDFDNPTIAASANVADWTATGITTLRNDTPGDWEELISLTVDSSAPRTFRVGVLAGNEANSDGRWDPNGLRIVAGGEVKATVTNLEVGFGMVFFDIIVGEGGGAFAIEGQSRDVGGNTRGPSIAGIVLDSVAGSAVTQAYTVGNGSGYDITGAEVTGFRSTNITKSFDQENGNVYGTQGYYFFGNGVDNTSNTNGLPSWVNNVAFEGNTVVNQAYTLFDNPTLPLSGNVANWGTTGIHVLRNDTPGNWEELISFTVDSSSPRTFRMGVMAGNEGNSDGRWDPVALRVLSDGDVLATVTNLETVLGMVFFDILIPDGATGEFSIEGETRDAGATSRGPSIAGIVFDTIASSGYTEWLSEFGAAASGSDNDGIGNLLEYVLNGNPNVPNLDILPRVERATDSFRYSFTRRAESTEDTTQVFQYSTDLVNWVDVNINSDNATEVTIESATSGTEDVLIELDSDLEEEGQLFGRIKVTQ